jgi:acetyltransferase-like isoleucine patch superfamily enzyme
MWKNVFKHAAALVAVILVAPVALPVAAFRRWDTRDIVFQFGSQLMSLIPGMPGEYLRRPFYYLTIDTPWPGPTISFGTILAQRATTIDANVYIGAHCNLGACSIGADTLIGSGVSVASAAAHSFEDLSAPISSQGGRFDVVRVGRNCWIANCSVVLADIGDAVVVGAGSVVVKPCTPRAIYVGNPARKVRDR